MELSVIVPVYCVEPYLRRCVDSILAQTFTDFELILVDDGSPDGCPTICDEYVTKDQRVHVIHQENAGVSAARNLGIEVSKGRYIGFVDSDDYIHPQMFELLHLAAIRSDADIAQCDLTHTTKTELPNWPTLVLPDLEVITHDDLGAIFYPELWNKVTGYMCTKIYKKEVFQSVRFPLGKRYEDIAILPEVLSESRTVVMFKLPLYYYYGRPDSLQCSPLNMQKVIDHLDAYTRHQRFFQDRRNSIQTLRAQGAYLTIYIQYKLRIWSIYPQFKKSFRPIARQLWKILPSIMKNPEICNLQKLVLITLAINCRIAVKLCRKYYPECIPSEIK